MPIATTDEQRAAVDVVRSWAAKSRTLATARSQESTPDAWRKHWPELTGMGLVSVALPLESGGGGGSVVDLAVVLEAAADALVPGPLLQTALAAMVVSRAECADRDALLAGLVDGSVTAAVALPTGEPATVSASQHADGSLVVDGTIATVIGVDAESLLVVRAGDAWVAIPASDDGVSITDLAPADFSRSVGSVRFVNVRVPASRVLTGIDTTFVDELAAVLLSAEASGIAGWALRTAVDYAKVREQFGKSIGSFQAIKHLCAEMLCRVEQASAVAWDAAEAFDDGPEQRSIATAVAASLALDAAVATTKDCIQVLGGIGFTWEHDAHLYLRRALALRQGVGGSARWRRRAADLALAGVHRELHIDLGVDADAERAAVHATVSRIAALPVDEQRVALADAGYLAPHWPAPYGLDADPAHQLVIQQEVAHAGIHRPDLVIAGWAIPTILQAGTDEQREKFVRPTLRGELVWCQLFSEPGAGSDLASLRTKATKVDGGWSLSGQKVWTSVARRAHWGICLARTDPDAPKHKGITYFLVDMSSPGLDIRPLREITGEAMFNEVFLDDVFVPDELVVGDVNDGWKLARATLVNERIAMAGTGIDAELEAVLTLAGRLGVTSDEQVRETLGGLVSVGLSGSLLDVRSTLRQLEGKDASAESSVRKLIGVRHRQAVAETGIELLGSSAVVAGDEVHAFLMTRCLTIAGGTTQVLLTLAGERILGLPRA